MGVAEDLLTLAGRLADALPTEPARLRVRRSISTAYSMDKQALVADAQFAFDNWNTIRSHSAANEYLLSLLIGNKRE